MNHYDLAIIGGGPIGITIAEHLPRKKTALITLDGSPETYLYRLEKALHQHGDPKEPFFIPDGVDHFHGACQFADETTLLINNQEKISAKKFVIASGATPAFPSVKGLDQLELTSPLQALAHKPALSSALIVGGGPTGVSLAGLLHTRGTHVTLLCSTDTILPSEETECSYFIQERLSKNGVKILTGSQLLEVSSHGEKKKAVVVKNMAKQEIAAEHIIIATGLKPHTAGLNLKSAGVYVAPHGPLVVNDEMQTSSSHIWAAGAVTGALHMAALELHQASVIANNIDAPFFSKTKIEPEPLPKILPTTPRIARLGLRENEATFKHKRIKTTVLREKESFLKLIGIKKTGEIIGVHIVSEQAAELILVFDLAMRAGISLYDLKDRHHYPAFTGADLVYQAIIAWTKP